MEINEISGERINFRLVLPQDADFIYSLRTNLNYNSYLSEVTGGVASQREWIKSYKQKEAALEELYFVITDKNNNPCGVVRIYEIETNTFTWGSWILTSDKPAKAALESAVIIYDVGFIELNLNEAHFEVDKRNVRTLEFHRRFGANEVGDDETNYYFRYSKDDFQNMREEFRKILVSGDPS